MNGIGVAALEIQTLLEQWGYEFCIIGGLAVVYWGNPRTTQDVDICLIVPLGKEAETASRLLSRIEARIENAVAFAAESRMLLARASNGTPIDIALASFPIEATMIARASRCELQPGLSLRIISAEDLIVTKAIAGRPQDRSDIQGIIDRQRDQLDRQQVLNDLSSFCELLETDEPLRLVKLLLRD